MKTPALSCLALAAAMTVVGCTPSAPTSQSSPRSEATPVDTSIAPPQTGIPSPAAPTTAPAGSVTAVDLPSDQDLVWSPENRWTAGATTSGGGAEQLSVCQQNRLESLGANATQVRRFTLTEGGTAIAIAMSFDSTAIADQAYATVQEWTADCAPVLQAQGRQDGKQTVPATSVAVIGGRAQVTEWAYAESAGSGEFESQGLFQLGDRVGLVLMRIEGEDNSWDLEPGGPVGMVHPMVRTVPAAAENLGR